MEKRDNRGFEFFDVHTHFQLHEDQECSRKLLSNVSMEGFGLMGTNYKDWEVVKKLALEFPTKIVPGFGIHPFSVNAILLADPVDNPNEIGPRPNPIPFDWEKDLENLLCEFPNSIVGEIGLDKVATDKITGAKYGLELQMNVFDRQFRIASRLNRPVSVHCLKSRMRND
ncbi:Cut9-interacting protein scn1 [Smittium mucronatum]|uniref:Cut9-interacting protein scn1 n=1 Tax=Smittium mucronatum TaxID=133383 RepID=A0A1R0GMN1_9FUNG|nr:Cut9-interacting protein scn1 [Smittium mucronatum]